MSWVKNSRTSTETTYRLVHRHARITAPRSKVRGCLGWKGAIGTEHSLKWAGQWARVDRSPTGIHKKLNASRFSSIQLKQMRKGPALFRRISSCAATCLVACGYVPLGLRLRATTC